MILMSNIRDNMVEKSVKKFGQGRPPPFSMPKNICMDIPNKDDKNMKLKFDRHVPAPTNQMVPR